MNKIIKKFVFNIIFILKDKTKNVLNKLNNFKSLYNQYDNLKS